MRTGIATVALVIALTAAARADVTVVQSMTVEGAITALLGGAPLPRLTLRIKGTKARADVDVKGEQASSIVDVASKQVIILNSSQKRAVIPDSLGPDRPISLPKIDVTFNPTGKGQTLEGQKCEEHTVTIRVDLSTLSGERMSPEAAAALKGIQIVMNGSMWIAPKAPGAGEYVAFHKAAIESSLLNAMMGLGGRKPAGGLDRLMEAVASAPGIPYLTEINITLEGKGAIVEAAKQFGPVRVIQRITSVSTERIPAGTFEVPEGYEVRRR